MRKGSFREKNKPIISLRNLSDKGQILVPKADYKSADPIPDSWVMIKPGDVIISDSGTIRLIIKKNWQAGEVESLRITWELANEKLEASLEVERMEIDTSNFDFLSAALRPVMSNDISPHEYRSEYFTRAVRFNILTFLGFGKTGFDIHQLMPEKNSRKMPEEFSLEFKLDTTSNTILSVLNPDKSKTPKNKPDQIEISVHWKKHEKLHLYQICAINYPPGVNAVTLESVVLAGEIANLFCLANMMKEK